MRQNVKLNEVNIIITIIIINVIHNQNFVHSDGNSELPSSNLLLRFLKLVAYHHIPEN